MSTHPESHPQDGLLLPGLDGANPLGFLAALGLLRILDEAQGPRRFRMKWVRLEGTWRPTITNVQGSMPLEEELLELMTGRLATAFNDHPVRILEDLNEASEDGKKRRALFSTVIKDSERIRMDWLSALASDFAPPEAICQLQTTRRDYFLGNVQSVINRTTSEHLRRAIFQSWDYADALDNQSLHLDPSEDRRHAHQWNKPAGDPERKTRGGMLGANRLALDALPLFPSFPEDGTLRTVGFSGNRSTNTRWTWPIWEATLSLCVIRSLLAAEPLQKETLEPDDIASLKESGVTAAYRTRRILVGKTPNFTPALCIA